MAEQVPQRKAVERLRVYYQGQVQASRPIFPGSDAGRAEDDADAAARDLAATRETMVALAGKLGSAIEENERASAELAIAEAHVVLANIAPNYQQAARLRKRAQTDWTKTKDVLDQTAGNVDAFAVAAQHRLALALRLVWHPSLAARIENVAAAQQEMACWLRLCARLQACRTPLLAARKSTLQARVMFATFTANRRFRPLEEKILANLDAAVRQLRCRQGGDRRLSLSFRAWHARHYLRRLLAPAIANRNDIGAVTVGVMGAMERYTDLSFRVLARLVDVAERVEAALAMAPLPAPDDSADRERALANQQRQARRYWLSYGLRAVIGVLLLTLLVWGSINPPTLPNLPWEDGRPGGMAYRPAGFSLQASTNSLTMNYHPSPPPGQPNWYKPENPGYYQPGQPGHQPWMPNYWQPGYGQFYSPNVAQPGPKGATGPVAGGYQPPKTYQPPTQYNPGAYGPRNVPSSPQPGGGRPGVPQPGRPNPGGFSPPGGGYRPPSPGGGGGGGHR